MPRVVIIGTSGAGKTSLARELSRRWNVPYYDLDDLYWLPGWQQREEREFQEMIQRIVQQSEWIISGNYSRVRPLVWGRATMILWLDYSFLRCFIQCLIRCLRRIIRHEPCCNGNYETFSRTLLSKHSILLWIIKSYGRHKQEYQRLFDHPDFPAARFLRFQSPEAMLRWLYASDVPIERR